MYIRKTYDGYFLMADYGYGGGFEEVQECESRADARQQLATYRENAPEYAYRIVCKRVKKGATHETV